jgi:small subunit ribosomal protein S19
MAKKEFNYYGKTLEELQAMSVEDFAQLLPSRKRRTLQRGYTEAQKAFMKKLETKTKPVETHCRDIIVLPSFVGKNIKVHNGKDFVSLIVEADMIGYRLGELVVTRKIVKHSSPGIGATRSSAAMSVR